MIVMLPLLLLSVSGSALVISVVAQECPPYVKHAARRNPPFSPGVYSYPFQRPAPECRTLQDPVIEQTITNLNTSSIADPDLHWLFANAWPNTLDTTVKWTGFAAENPDEELAFIITGDINAMWIRDSANQLQSYKPILSSSPNISSLYRGAINLQARYLQKSPHCNAFQPPVESGMPPEYDHAAGDIVTPEYDPAFVFECKYEIDSLAAFLQLSWDYFEATGDAAFFAKFAWSDAVRVVLKTARDLMQGTYTKDGRLRESPYTWLRKATSSSETVANKGVGAPVKSDIGLVRSVFRPSDDSCIYQYFIPGNMMLARYVKATAKIMETIDKNLAQEMADLGTGIEKSIEEHAIVDHPNHGRVYAYEIDGFGSFNLMDDANIPSLLSIPHIGFKPATDQVYTNTRALVLGKSNPYFAFGPIINATGGPHVGPGNGWPMAVIMQIMTSDDDEEIIGGLKMLMGSTSSLGLIHESVNSHQDGEWTRPW